MQLHVVSATRRSADSFWSESALGLSLRRLAADSRLLAWIAFANEQGLPDIYNQILARDSPDDIAVFVHDDVWLDDLLFADRVIAGLQAYDVLGLAGNRRRVAGQPGWAFVNRELQWDAVTNLSGQVGHGEQSFGRVTVYGPSAQCELLDGVLLAARIKTLQDARCRFDPRFRFHFYDLDFCRTARQQGLRLGTWPIGVTHQSGGAFATPGWWQAYEEYLAKWAS